MNGKLSASVCAVVFTVALAGHSNATAGAPTEQVRLTVDRVLLILKNPSLKSNGATNKRREELRQVIFPRFDFEEMAKRSLGTEWGRHTPEEQKEFVALFTELLRNSYVTSIESYQGDKVIYGREHQDGRYAEVRTTIVTDRSEQFAIDYRLHPVGGEWKVYDVVIQNISIVNNFRSQFHRVLNRSSFKELLRTMRDKAQ